MPTGLSEKIHRAALDQGRMQADELSHMLNRLSDPFLAFDNQLSLRYINESAKDLLRRRPDTLDESIYEAYRKSLSDQQTICLEACSPDAEGWLEHHIHPSEDGLSVYIRDITEKKKAELKQSQLNEQLLNLSANLENIREEERSNLARDLHDELGQQLTALAMDISWLDKYIQNENECTHERINDIARLLDEIVETVRRISTTLRPGVLDDLGITATLEWQSREFEKRSGIRIHAQFQEMELSLSPNEATCLFRIYQESLTNIARHANAQKVSASLELKDDCVFLSITDDGKGFDIGTVGHKKRTNGLRGMKERALLAGGICEIISDPGNGTIVSVSIPKQKTPNYDPYYHCG